MLGLGRGVGGQQGNWGEKITPNGVNLLYAEARWSHTAFAMGQFLSAPRPVWAA